MAATLVRIVLRWRVPMLELGSVAAIAVGLGDRFGVWAGALVLGAAGLVKAVELEARELQR
jgi:hypothetical protein